MRLLASRKISDGVAWVKEQAAAGADVEQAVEKGKSQFVGPELSGKMLGVIGLGPSACRWPTSPPSWA